MFKNKSKSGKNNICGEKVYFFRKQYSPKMSQRILAEQLQMMGIEVDKNAVQRIESGQRFVTDIEIVALAKVFKVSCGELLGEYKKRLKLTLLFGLYICARKRPYKT